MSYRSVSGVALCASVICVAGLGQSVYAGVVFGLGTGLAGGYRWDAAPRTINFGGTNYERSLDGGLRFSLQGGSYQAYRDFFPGILCLPSLTSRRLSTRLSGRGPASIR